MPNLTFRSRPRVRHSITGSKLREWKSEDGRYIVIEITNAFYGRWFRAVRQYARSQAFVSDRLKTRAQAEQACAQHRSQ